MLDFFNTLYITNELCYNGSGETMKKILLFMISLLLVGCKGHKQPISTKIHQLTSQSPDQMESYVLTTSNGLCLVFDGGRDADMEYLVDYIKEHDDNATVDGWFITHYHKDHASALALYLESGRDDLDIKAIYHDLPSKETVEQYNPNRFAEYMRIQDAINYFENVIRVKEGDLIQYSGLSVEILNSVQVFENNFGNNTSIVYKVQNDTTSLLILGDTGEELADYLIAHQYDKIKNVDYVQMAHHGQRGGSQELYSIIHPKVCLWPLTEWIYTNNNGTTDLKFDETYDWVKEIEHEDYYAKDGTLVIEMK